MEFNRVYQVYSMLAPKPHDLVQRGRFYIREGYVRMWKDNKQKFKKRYCFLFNDVMLLCKKEGKLSSKKYWLRIHITLRSPHCSVEDNSNSYNNDFNLICRSRSFRFQVDSSNLKASWIEDIRKSITGEHEESQKEADKSRDALLKGDLSLTGQNRTTSTKGNSKGKRKSESYESDTSEEEPKPKQKIKETSDSSPPKKKKVKKEKRVEMVTENESFLFDIPSTTSTFNFFTGNQTSGSNSNPFSPQVQNSQPNGNNGNNGNNSNPFSPQVQNNPNPFQSQPSNPFSPTQNAAPFGQTPTSTTSSYNPFEQSHPQPQVQTSYNPFGPPTVQTTQPQDQGFNPFL